MLNKCTEYVFEEQGCPKRFVHAVDTGVKLPCRQGYKEPFAGTSLAVQWLRFSLPRQEAWVWFLVRKLKSHVPWGQETKT